MKKRTEFLKKARSFLVVEKLFTWIFKTTCWIRTSSFQNNLKTWCGAFMKNQKLHKFSPSRRLSRLRTIAWSRNLSVLLCCLMKDIFRAFSLLKIMRWKVTLHKYSRMIVIMRETVPETQNLRTLSKFIEKWSSN
jgi:hypothetical protein